MLSGVSGALDLWALHQQFLGVISVVLLASLGEFGESKGAGQGQQRRSVDLGCPQFPAPSQWACYRFAAKLREHGGALATCIDSVLAKLRDAKPEMGKTVAIDGSDLPAYANGQKYLWRGGPERKKFSDPDASWGHRPSISTRSGGGYYGYQVHAAVDTATGLPVAWKVRKAKDPEQAEVPSLLDEIGRSRTASTSRRPASTASGRSPGRTPSGARRSGAALRVSASRSQSGLRRQGCTGGAAQH